MKATHKARLLVGTSVLLWSPLAAWAQTLGGTAQTYSTQEPLTVVTVLLISAFAIDRIVTGILAMIPSKGDSSARSRKLYLALAGVLGVILGLVGKVGVLGNLGFSNEVVLNVTLTTLILMAGSDRIGVLMAKMGGKPAIGKETEEPIEITGKLTLVDERTAQVEAAAVGVSSELPKAAAATAGLGASHPTGSTP